MVKSSLGLAVAAMLWAGPAQAVVYEFDIDSGGQNFEIRIDYGRNLVTTSFFNRPGLMFGYTLYEYDTGKGVWLTAEWSDTSFPDYPPIPPSGPGNTIDYRREVFSLNMVATFADGPDDYMESYGGLTNHFEFQASHKMTDYGRLTEDGKPYDFYESVIDSANWTASGPSNVFVVTSVPEPATWAMMLIGFAALACAHKRRAAVS